MARETTWYSWDEWNHVKDLLYSYDNRAKQIDGLKMVDMWRCRVRTGTLPISVELTAALVRVQLANLESSNSNSVRRHSSAMALVRFVNGTTDQLQAGVYAESVQTIADRINIPEWLVDLRHSATHSHLPSLEVLSAGISFALGWLQETYWHETLMKMTEKTDYLRVSLRDSLSEYIKIVFGILCERVYNSGDNPGEIIDPKLVKEKRKTENRNLARCREISQSVVRIINPGNISEVIRIFLLDGFFIPSENHVRILNIPTGAEGLDEEDKATLNKLRDVWKPMLTTVGNKYPAFFELLAKGLVLYCQSTSQSQMNRTSGLIALYVLTSTLTSFKCPRNLVLFLLRNPSPLAFHTLQCIIDRSSCAEYDKLQRTLDVFGDCVPVLMKPINVDIDLERELAGHPLNDVLKAIQEKNKTKVDTKPVISKWTLVDPSRVQKLPTMGKFHPVVPIASQSTKTSKSSAIAPTVCSNSVGVGVSIDMAYSNQRLSEMIEAMFCDESILIDDSDCDNVSCMTDEYRMDQDMPWDESCAELDIKCEHKPSIMQHVANINVSNIMFI